MFLILLLFLGCSKNSPKYIDGDDLVPPGPPIWGFFTIAGIDSDKDGVRDDVELWINSTIKGRNERLAAKSYTQVHMDMMRNAHKKDAFLKLINEENIRSNCFNFVNLGMTNASSHYLKTQLFDQIYDNMWRKNRTAEGYQHKESGSYRVASVEPYELGIGCRFKIQNVWSIIDSFLIRQQNYKMDNLKRNRIKDMYEDNPGNYNANDLMDERRSGP